MPLRARVELRESFERSSMPGSHVSGVLDPHIV